MQHVLSVSEINKYIKGIISRDFILSSLWVRGEITNYKYHYSGHMYFTVKDESSIIKCVMFKTQNSTLKFAPENGMRVLIKGYISVFERDGQYQFYAEEMQPDGIGNLHIAFEQLKKKLQDEGMFDTARKREIPFLPRAIGVVTSSTGAVIRDIINILYRRFNNVELKIFPTAVQGEAAPKQIVRAIKKLNELKCVDVIIVARGGGSLEELWAFNEEIVARSIFESTIPVISAVGHETDFTIADFVADVRAPTPSAAAELVIPEKSVLQNRMMNINARLTNSVIKKLSMKRAKYESLKNSMIFKQPYDRIYQNRMKLDVLNKYMHNGLQMGSEKAKSRLNFLTGKLDALSPLKILSRGYSVVKLAKEDIYVKSIEDVHCGDKIEVSVKDGKIECTIDKVEKREA